MRSAHGIRILLLATLIAPAGPARAAFIDFEYRAERFAVSGQTSFVDEFDSGAVPPWIVALGTASESGGVLRLENPGDVAQPLELIGGPPLEISNAIAPAAANVTDGAGDFAATSRWLDLPGSPPGSLGGFYAMQLFTTKTSAEPTCAALAAAAGEPAVLEVVAVTLAMRNFDPLVPPFVSPAGLATVFVLTRTCVGAITDPLDNRVYLRTRIDGASIDPADVTGDVVLDLDFDDTTNTVTPSYSLDSGGSFSTLSPLVGFEPFGVGRFQLIAQPIRAPGVPLLGPAGAAALALLLAGAGARLARRRQRAMRGAR